MQFEVEFTNEPTSIPVISAMLREALNQLPIDVKSANALVKLALASIRDAVEHAYQQGEEGSIRLTFRKRGSKLDIRVRDFGMPQDMTTLERRFQTPDALDHQIADQVHWQSFGPDGKEVQIVKWLPPDDQTQRITAEQRSPLSHDVPAAAQQEYSIQRMDDDQAVQVSQLMYRAYGNTYFNEDVYYPDRLLTQNADDKVLSFVALGNDGDVVGHYALELNQDGPVAEGGQAVVDPAHRGRGLLDRLKEVAIQEAHRLKLVGWFADAVCVHMRTQQSHVHHDGHLTAVDLAIAPKSERFQNIVNTQQQRVSCLLYFHWLSEPKSRTVYVPSRHQDVVSKIYENLRCKISFGDEMAAMGNGRLTVGMDNGAAKGVIRADELGAETVRSIRHAKRELIERSRAEVVFVDLPLTNPATASVASSLETDGFGFVGVAPHFSSSGDMLRLAYLIEPLAREPIKTFEEFADDLVDYVLTEQTRLSEQL